MCSSCPKNCKGIDVQRGQPVVELHAAAVPGRNEQGERYEERGKKRLLQGGDGLARFDAGGATLDGLLFHE